MTLREKLIALADDAAIADGITWTSNAEWRIRTLVIAAARLALENAAVTARRNMQEVECDEWDRGFNAGCESAGRDILARAKELTP